MISTTLFLVYTALLFVIPCLEHTQPLWYKTLRHNIDYTTNGRRFMAYVLALFVIFFHVVYYAAFPSNQGIMLSTLIVFFFLSTKRSVLLLGWLSKSTTTLFILMIVVLALSFIPFLFPTAVALAFLLQIACILPKDKPDNTRPFITITKREEELGSSYIDQNVVDAEVISEETVA